MNSNKFLTYSVLQHQPKYEIDVLPLAMVQFWHPKSYPEFQIPLNNYNYIYEKFMIDFNQYYNKFIHFIPICNDNNEHDYVWGYTWHPMIYDVHICNDEIKCIRSAKGYDPYNKQILISSPQSFAAHDVKYIGKGSKILSFGLKSYFLMDPGRLKTLRGCTYQEYIHKNGNVEDVNEKSKYSTQSINVRQLLVDLMLVNLVC